MVPDARSYSENWRDYPGGIWHSRRVELSNTNARAIHDDGSRRRQPIAIIRCALDLPEHELGASICVCQTLIITGASRRARDLEQNKNNLAPIDSARFTIFERARIFSCATKLEAVKGR